MAVPQERPAPKPLSKMRWHGGSAVENGFMKGEGYASSTGVAVTIQIHEYFLPVDTEIATARR